MHLRSNLNTGSRLSTNITSGLHSGILSHAVSQAKQEERSCESQCILATSSQAAKKSISGRNGNPVQDTSMSTLRTLGAQNTNDRRPSGNRSTE